jgi:hypothetical protein
MGLIFFFLSLFESNKNGVLLVFLSIVALVLIVGSAVIVTQYLRTPNNPILYNESEKAIYVGNTKIYLNEIEDLSYVRAAARGIQYKWGTVKIKTKDSKYVVRYIADCEDVCKRLTHLKYTSGNTSLFFNQ